MVWFKNFKNSVEYIFFVFAFPLALMMSGGESETVENGFWFYYLVVFFDTSFLLLKEKFNSWKKGETENFYDYMLWYKCYATFMVVQFVSGVLFGRVSLAPVSLVLVLFLLRFQMYQRVIEKEKFKL